MPPMPTTPLMPPTPKPRSNFDVHKSIKLSFPVFEEASGGVDDYIADINAWMRLSNVTDQKDKFDVLFLKAPVRVKSQVRHLDPEKLETPYDELVKEIRRILQESEQERMAKLMEHKEIGDMRPSEFLNDMRKLKATQDEATLRSIWFLRLPQYLKVGLANHQTLTLKELIESADNIHSAVGTARKTLHEISAPPPPVAAAPAPIPGMAEMMMCIQQMTVAIAGIAEGQQRRDRDRSRGNGRSTRGQTTNRDRSRGSSRTRPPAGTCWFHHRFGDRSYRCEAPCVFENRPRPPPPN